MAEKDETEKTIAEDLVVTKYKMAGDIVNRALKLVLDKCVDGANVREVCEFGDQFMAEETSKVFKKEKEMKKGVAFPTSISINNCICHFSPTSRDPDVLLKNGDLVKVDLGAHVDGFIAVVAHTATVGLLPGNKVSGRQADVILAAHQASQAALRLLKPGNETYSITNAVQKICEDYKCKPVEGMLSHQLKQYRIDGEKTVIQNPNEAQKKEHEKFTLEVHEVYAMDVLVSTGEGVGKEANSRVTIYKKTDETYQLKMKASRTFYSEVVHKHGTMPFNLRTFEDETKAKLGALECVNHKLIEPFQVLYDKPGEHVAQFKFTVLLMPTGTLRITGLPFEQDLYSSENGVTDPELKQLLASSANPKNTKKKNKKKSEKMQEEAMEVDG
ncbi:proliferation-associated protein 2G4 [Frankliniella occidentalis]|uniref:Proliferation-associated protein 2G4 n=1 Tax=Frankliniella occidentalis TaxID=133901 RepID=A0A6J1SET5_FRAOC|nr:proliferation-associated protein 2G4 [Frankliniella occidentalis]